MRRKGKNLCTAAIMGLVFLVSCGLFKGVEMDSSKNLEVPVSNVTSIKTITTKKVVVSDAYMQNALEKEVAYLKSIDDDRMLAGFRETAGLDMKGKKRYEGWECMLIGGHTMGHYLTALSQAAINCNVSENDRKIFEEKIEYIVGALLECQQNTKGKEGFIFGAQILDKSNVEAQFDNVEIAKVDLMTQAWVPWYTMHKIIAGLISVYENTGNETSLEVAKGLGDWIYNRATSWDENLRNTVLETEYGGMNDALYELFGITGDEKYAVAAHVFDEEELFENVYSGRANVLNDLHANTTIPKFQGALNRYVMLDGKEIEDEVVDASKYLEYAEVFFDLVVEKHTYATGGNSEWEHFGIDNNLDRERTNCNNETCNVYNMLKMARMLFQITGDAKYLNYYENAFINTILSSQNPETGMTTYFQPMATGYFKVFGEEYNKFWCCVGTGMENFTKLGDSFYYYDDEYVYISTYFSSECDIEDECSLVMTADLMNSDKVRIEVKNENGNLNKTMALRIPGWIDGELEVAINSTKADLDFDTKQGFAIITDELKEGDVVEVTLPMKVYAKTLPDNESSLALCYGPYVLSADLGCENEKKTATGVGVTIPVEPIVESEIISLPDDVSLSDFEKNTSEYVSPVMNSRKGAEFKVAGCNYIFAPHYLKYSERYGIYFYYKN